MIDVDLKGLDPQILPFDEVRALRSIAKSFYLFLRSGHSIDLQGIGIFIGGYNKGLLSCNTKLLRGYLKKIISLSNDRLFAHNSNSEMKEYFSPIPDKVEMLFKD